MGKTSLLNEIEIFLRNQRKINFATLKEFSNSPLGNLIQEIVSKRKFFSLENESHRPLSETLVLCADFIYQFEKLLSKYSKRKKLLIISDRGIHSFLTYQYLRIRDIYQNKKFAFFKEWIKDLFQVIGFPDFVFLLISPLSDIKGRIIERDGTIAEGELEFIEKVQNEYLKIFKEKQMSPYLILENQNGKFEFIKEKAIEKMKEIIKKPSFF